MSWIKFYWTGSIKASVKIGKHALIWTGVYGIQIGSVFIGIIIGDGDDS